MRIISLFQRPDLADTCAAWSFGEWGCLNGNGSLADYVERYRARSKNFNVLPVAWLAMSSDNKPMGMAGLKENDHPDRADLTPWLASVFVHPLYRRQGIAAKLVAYVEEQAGSLFGCKTLYLYSSRDGKNIYRRLGWTDIGKVRDLKGNDPEGKALMKKELAHV